MGTSTCNQSPSPRPRRRWPLTCCLQLVLKLWKVKCLVVRFLRAAAAAASAAAAAAAAALITQTPACLLSHQVWTLLRQRIPRLPARAALPVAAHLRLIPPRP